jgi:hypothetical protein
MSKIKRPALALQSTDPREYTRQLAAWYSDRDRRENVYYQVLELPGGNFGVDQAFDGVPFPDFLAKNGAKPAEQFRCGREVKPVAA